MKACPSCGEQHPDRFRLCPICGTPLAASIESTSEERKLVTVLFCDLVGFTSRSERMDIEDVRGTLDPYHRLLRGELERHGGTVEKFIGDAVMALFGAPRSRDDDAERAVRAALGVQQAVGRLRADDEALDLHVRIGVNTGEVVVKLDALPAQGEGMVFGDPVNVAARLQSAAPVDGVLVGDETYHLTRDTIEYEPVAPISAKGKREPVKAWRAVASRASVADFIPMVGRVDELRRLEAALPDTAHAEPWVLAIIGEVGVGKSRLLRQLEVRAASRGDPPGWHRAAASEIAASPYGPFAEVLRSLTGVSAAADVDAARSTLVEAVTRLVEDAPARAWVAHEVGVLLGLFDPASDGDRKVEAFGAWARLVADAARRQPQVLVFDDLHWADDALLDLISDLRPRLEGCAVLIVLALRPDARERVEGRELGDETLVLAALDDEDATRLLRVSLPGGESRHRLGDVVRLARGNPLFLREYAHLIEEKPAGLGEGEPGQQPLPIPRSVQAVIAARLDALPADEKALAQIAATLGEAITPDGVAACAGRPASAVEAHLGLLAARGVLDRSPATSAEREYRFHHDLVRAVAYGTLPRRRRAEIHLCAGDWLAVGRDGNRTELRAHHYMAALELLRATRQPDGEAAGKAQRACAAAGDAAYAVNAFGAAAAHYKQALTLAEQRSAGDRPKLLLALGKARYHVRDEFPTELAAASDLLRVTGDVEAAAEAEMLTGFWLGNHGRMEEGLAHSWTARSLLANSPPSRLRAEIAISLGERAVLSGDTDEGAQLCREALSIASELEIDEVAGQGMLALAVARVMRGDAQVGDELNRVLEAISHAHSPRAAIITMNTADVLRWLGALAASFRAQQDGERRAAELETAFLRRLTDAERVRRAWYHGAWDAALAGADQILGEVDHGSPFHLEVTLRIIRAHVRATNGALGAAQQDLARALEAARRSNDPETLVPALAASARTAVLSGAPARALPVLGEIQRALEEGPRFLWGPALGDVAIAAEGCARSAALRPLLEGSPRTPWRQAALLVVDGELETAVGCYRQIGSAPDQRNVAALAQARLEL